MSFNFQVTEYTAYVVLVSDEEIVHARVTLTQELYGVWTLTIRQHWETVVFCETFRSYDPLKDASEKLTTLGYSG